jgi:putative NADPH-quinone reductase
VAHKIAIIQGHPDQAGRHFCHALADAYGQGAQSAGHEVFRIEVAQLGFPLLRTKEEFYSGSPPSSLKPAQEIIASAGHLVIVYPLWLGEMPALLARSGFINMEAQACFLRGLIGRFRLERHEAVKWSLIRPVEGQAA